MVASEEVLEETTWRLFQASGLIHMVQHGIGVGFRV